MKPILFFLFAVLTMYSADAQSVGIGTTTPNSRAALEINSTTKGLLIPSMTTSQRLAISTPPNGLMVYDIERGSFYHHTGTGWSAILNGDYWIRPSATRSRISNSSDSVGIGMNAPTEWLDVDGNIRTRNDLLADGKVVATGMVSGASLQTPGSLVVSGIGLVNGNFTANSNLAVTGNSALNGNVTTTGNVLIDNTEAILQLSSNGDGKGFFQLSDNNVRIGTNASNTSGKFIIRTGGADRVYVNPDGNMGIGTIAPRAPLHVNNGDVLFTATGPVPGTAGDPPITGAGRRMMWYTDKAAFRAGYVTDNRWNIQNVGQYSFAGGNDVMAYGDYSTVFGWQSSAAVFAFAAGYKNVASGTASVALGTSANATGHYSCALGTLVDATGDNSFALGNNVSTNGHTGSFYLGDASTSSGTSNTFDNQMAMRFSGGYRFYSNWQTTNGVFMNPGGNSWLTLSDSTKKENYKPANGKAFLQKIAGMRLGTWNYKDQDKTIFRHYGPMAQEFYANFGTDGIGRIGNDTTIASADIDGVMMIALQALITEKEVLKNNFEKQAAEIDKLKENEKNLLERLKKIEAILPKGLTTGN
jgi:hypothetical protein